MAWVLSNKKGSGGGGSNVIANPTGTATDTLNKLQVDETIYRIEGGGGGSSADHITLTQAEYDALVEAGTVDPDAFYFIKDTNGDGQNFQPVIYSEDEREIGVWTNGKPLYEKTIIGQLSAGSDTDVDLSSLNIDNFILVNANAERINTNAGSIIYSYVGIDINVNPSSPNLLRFNFKFYKQSNILKITSYTQATTEEDVGNYIAVIRYTKTTDQPGSGQWTPQGLPSQHYSTNEQVVGTWVDGSTLYEKTFEITSQISLSANTWTQTPFDQGDINRITRVTVSDSTGACADNLACGFVSNKIALNSTRAVQFNETSYLTIRYTKSTS